LPKNKEKYLTGLKVATQTTKMSRSKTHSQEQWWCWQQ
jgi:hypothetical protein